VHLLAERTAEELSGMPPYTSERFPETASVTPVQAS
jgi:hypothetical protein